MKKGLDGDTFRMKKIFLFLKKHMPALCALVLAGMFVLSAVWLRASGLEKAFSGVSGEGEGAEIKETADEEEAFHPPALGDVIAPFSENELMYNPTTRVYEIHTGTDFLCSDGNVYCVADGRVEDVFYDPLWGNTIILLHENGDQSVYASLSESLVKKGAYTKKGDVIGKSGASAAVEEKTGPHLHFEYMKTGKSHPIAFTIVPET